MGGGLILRGLTGFLGTSYSEERSTILHIYISISPSVPIKRSNKMRYTRRASERSEHPVRTRQSVCKAGMRNEKAHVLRLLRRHSTCGTRKCTVHFECATFTHRRHHLNIYAKKFTAKELNAFRCVTKSWPLYFLKCATGIHEVNGSGALGMWRYS